MINWGALIIPLDIVSAIADAEECLGWLGGGGLKQERVFVVTSAQIGAETKYCSYFMELFPHRSFDPLEGGFQEQLIPWRRSPLGLLRESSVPSSGSRPPNSRLRSPSTQKRSKARASVFA